MLELYPWQKKAWQQLMAMLEQQRMPHGLLISGNKGTGLQHLANCLSMRLLCLEPGDSEIACGRCQSCQLFQAGSHPDIKLLEPEEEGKQIRIAQVRELIEYVSLKSFSSRNKIAILHPADAMNRATANALLKTLEEPPEQSMLILLSSSPDRLPITIRSRCQQIEIKPALDEATVNWLQQQQSSDVAPELLLHLADGGPLRALNMLDDELFQHRQAMLSELKQLQAEKLNPVALANDWQNLGCERVIIMLMRFLQDLVRMKLLQDKAKLLNSDLKQDLQAMVNTLDLLKMLRIYGFLQEKYQQASGPMNYNPLALLEEIVIYWNNPTKSL